MDELRRIIRDVPDFPQKGVVFKDITTLLRDAAAFAEAIELFAELCREAPADAVVAIESRGFILGSAVAARLGLGFVPVRKPGKLPARTRRASYALEYGTDSLEIHEDAIRPGERILVVDDVFATGRARSRSWSRGWAGGSPSTRSSSSWASWRAARS